MCREYSVYVTGHSLFCVNGWASHSTRGAWKQTCCDFLPRRCLCTKQYFFFHYVKFLQPLQCLCVCVSAWAYTVHVLHSVLPCAVECSVSDSSARIGMICCYCCTGFLQAATKKRKKKGKPDIGSFQDSKIFSICETQSLTLEVLTNTGCWRIKW